MDFINIIESGFIRSQDLTKKSGCTYDKTDKSKVFITIVTDNAMNHGFNYQNGMRNYGLIIDKRILVERDDYHINTGWVGYVHENSLGPYSTFKRRDFKNFIDYIDKNLQTHDNLKLNEVLFDNEINLQEYVIGFVFLFGAIFRDFNFEYEKIFDPLYQFLENVNVKSYDTAISTYVDYNQVMRLIKLLYGSKKVFILVSETDFDVLIKFKKIKVIKNE